MATATTQNAQSDSAAPARSGAWPFEFAAAAVVIALAYRYPTYANSLYIREHLQFALLIPLGVLFLAYLRSETVGRTEPLPIHGATATTAILLGLSALLAFDSFLGYSAVSWSVSALLAALAFIHFWGGWALFRRVWPLWAFAWLMVPPPFGLDLKLINELQLWVSSLASYTLDSMHVAHVLEGVKINLENKELFVEEACSGINSLFATFVVLVFAMLVFKRNWLHILLLFTLGFVCVLAVNVFRVVTLTSFHYFWPKVGDFFDQGIPHTAFGLLCFALLILLVISVDSLLWVTVDFLFAAVSRTKKSSKSVGKRRTESGPDPEAEVTPDERSWLARITEGHRRLRLAAPRGAPIALAMGGVFTALAGLEYASGAYRLATQKPPVAASEGDPLADLVGTLPPEWDGWRREQAKSEHLSYTKAMYSTSWVYRRGNEEMTIFLHRRYPEFHGMEICYRGAGWQTRNVVSGGPETTKVKAPEDLRYITFDMDKRDEGGYVVGYLNFDFANRRWAGVPPEYQGLTLSGRAMLGINERMKTLKNLFKRSDYPTDLAVVLVQMRTTRAAESSDREETVERLIAASQQLFAPLLASNPGQ